jgi:phosphoserine phosphatase RsbU/P
VVFHKATFPDPDGAVGGLVGIIMDITNLKQAEEALRESEARFRAIFEYAPVGIGMADPTGRFLQSNQALLALLGYSADEFKGVSFQEMTHPEDLPRCQRQLEDLLTGEHQYFDAEKRCFRKDGGTVWVQVTMALLRNIPGEPQYLIATVIDITARKQAEESLRQSEKRFRDITEYAAEWVWEVDAQGKYLYSSPVVEQLLGYTPEEVLGELFL